MWNYKKLFIFFDTTTRANERSRRARANEPRRETLLIWCQCYDTSERWSTPTKQLILAASEFVFCLPKVNAHVSCKWFFCAAKNTNPYLALWCFSFTFLTLIAPCVHLFNMKTTQRLSSFLSHECGFFHWFSSLLAVFCLLEHRFTKLPHYFWGIKCRWLTLPFNDLLVLIFAVSIRSIVATAMMFSAALTDSIKILKQKDPLQTNDRNCNQAITSCSVKWQKYSNNENYHNYNHSNNSNHLINFMHERRLHKSKPNWNFLRFAINLKWICPLPLY